MVGLDFFKEEFFNKKVFITGHTGFKGSWLTYLLDSMGAITQGYGLEPNTSPSLYQKLIFTDRHSSKIADIRDIDTFEKEIVRCQPDYIFHLAAQPLVLESYENPLETFQTNFNGTLNLLEILRKHKIRSTTICITTDKVYENNELNLAFNENDKLGGNDPYSASKASCEILINSYRTSFFKNTKTKIASVRAGNVVGGGDWSKNRLIPDIIRSVFENKPLEIRNPKATRPWQHVLEPLFGYLMLAKALNNDIYFSEAFNFGPEAREVKSVEQILSVAKQIGIDLKVKKLKVTENNETQFLKLDIQKVKRRLDWAPKWNNLSTFQKTFQWYLDFYDGKPIEKLMRRDINSYLEEK